MCVKLLFIVCSRRHTCSLVHLDMRELLYPGLVTLYATFIMRVFVSVFRDADETERNKSTALIFWPLSSALAGLSLVEDFPYEPEERGSDYVRLASIAAGKFAGVSLQRKPAGPD